MVSHEDNGHSRENIFSRIVDCVIDIISLDAAIIRKEADLFFGSALMLVGLLHFRSDKFCDGNSVDYLSCTRPTAYHYYGSLEIAIIVIGSFFVLLWFMKRRSAR